MAERTGIEPATSCVTGLAITCSRTDVRGTTIGISAFHFCVRHGNRWFCSIMFARQIGLT